ncbi:glycosyltransferase [Photobacterium leiognathi]|uniref:glycosyltransferase n=1 Tax=Photobacterium leiognathi TaxID=553611 RepID=UPI002980E99D|nr:glycosyltransferase [Photobacterium leiognathi]
MKVLIDFSPIKTGGGAQLALNFLNYIQKIDMNFCILVSDKFPYIDRVASNTELIVSPSNYARRIFFENVTIKNEVESRGVTHIYTFFGPGLPVIKGVKQVVSVAYPIICNDESPYWKYIPKFEYLKKKAINYFRKKRLSRADFLLFETEVMQKRCVSVLNYDIDKTKVIPPSPTGFLKETNKKNNNNITRFLLLTGLDYHKNIWRLVQVLPLIYRNGLDVKFVISCERDDFYNKYNAHIRSIETHLVDKYFDFRGKVSSDQIQSIYDDVDVMLNISDLESFSNNYMESWRARKPILASDTDFSRYICDGSAIYVNPHDLDELCDKISMFVDSKLDIESMLVVGDQRLAFLPTLDERLRFIREVMFS